MSRGHDVPVPDPVANAIDAPMPATDGPEFERAFRAWEVTDRVRLGVPILVVAGMLTLLLGVVDIGYFGGRLEAGALALRVLLAGFSFLAAYQLADEHRAGRIDLWLFAWSFIVAATLAVRHLMATGQPPMHHALDVVMTLLWLLMPNPLRLQVVPALLIVGSALATDWGMANPAYLLAAYGFALLGGTVVAWERDRTAHARFRAVREVRTLRGLLPMCANCKKIRDDAGRWIPVESYLQARTEAEFTHGMCPTCLTSYYGIHAANH